MRLVCLGTAMLRGPGEYGVDDGDEGLGEGGVGFDGVAEGGERGAPALAVIAGGFDDVPEYRRVCTFVIEYPNVVVSPLGLLVSARQAHYSLLR